MSHLKVICDEISIYFVDEKTICKLHKLHFNDPTLTDCISIQVDEPGTLNCYLGEIYVCPQVAQTYIQKNKGNLYQEITLYLIHGILHLVGFDDIEPEDEKKMRLAEKDVMDYLLLNKKLISQ